MKPCALMSVALSASFAAACGADARAQASGSGASAPSANANIPGSFQGPRRADTAPSSQLEQIVVTAQKRSEKLQNVPVAVTAFSAKQLQITNVREVSDLSATVPNFSISEGGSGPGAAEIQLRGLSFQDIEKSFEPPIGLVIDGVYLATSTGQVAQAFDFSSLEVLAGPQGTLFGKNTTGGVINITRSKPDPGANGIHGQFELTGGNFGEHDGELVLTAPLIKDILAIKLAAFSQNNDGAFRDPTVGHNIGARDYQSFSIGADFRPDADTDIYAIFDRTLDHSQLNPTIFAGTPNALPLPVGGFIDGQDTPCLSVYLASSCVNASGKAPKNVATANSIPTAGYNLYAATVNAYHNFDKFKLVSVTGYRSSQEDSFNDYDSTPYTLYNTSRPQYYRQFSQELRYESNFSGPFNIVAGAYFFNSFYHLTQYTDFDLAALLPSVPPGAVILFPGSYVAQKSLSEALFFQGSYDFDSHWRLIFGARQSWDQKHIDLQLYTDPNDHQLGTINCTQTATGQDCQSVGRSQAWSQFTPKIGVQYRINPNAMAYFTYSKGYNSGGFNGRAGDVGVVGPYAPEQVHAFELGAKTTWLNNRLRVNADVFWNIFNNAQEEIIQQLPNGLTSTTVGNAAGAVFRGFEVEAAGKPTSDWTLSANLGFLNAYYTNFTAALLPGPPTDNSNLKVRRTPPVTIGANSDYIAPLPRGDLGFNVNLKFIAQQQFDLLNDPRGYQGPVTKLDLAVRYEVPVAGLDWTLSGFVKNVTNATPNNTFVTGYQGSFIEFWSQEIGRTYGVTLRAKF